LGTVSLFLELAFVFVGLPLGFDRLLRSGHQRLLFPGMWLLALGASVTLALDPTFDGRRLLSMPWGHPYVAVVVVRMALAVVALAIVARRLGLKPPVEISPMIRVLIIIFYPLLSVAPQGLVWRVFFIHRYEPVFGSGLSMLCASAIAFAFAHIIFRNPVAIAVTLAGGACFAHTYLVTGSMLLANLEHAFDGLLVFSLGLGRFLYLGAARATGPIQPAPESPPGRLGTRSDPRRR
jgi:uncharacterized protein